MNARALGIKTGAVLAQLLAEKAFGNRPVTLVGYSLGSLVIYEALLKLAALPPSETMHLIQDVYLFGSPVPADPSHWAKIRRIVSGRVVNGYSNRDYVLAVLSRAADATWNVAGLEPVGVKGVENILCGEVDGHTLWRGLVGKYLSRVRAPGLRVGEVHKQKTEVVDEIKASCD
jgi:pimeloyl-ACP methyl ester carboxylesterase